MKKETKISRNLVTNTIKKLGRQSDIFIQSLRLLKESWDKTDEATKTHVCSIWQNLQMQLYNETQHQLFNTHTYLTWLMRTIRSEIFGIPMRKNLQDDVFSWIWSAPDIASQFLGMLKSNINILHLDNVEKDLFKNLYEDLISKVFRVKRGEYNTPDWLAELILQKTLAEHSSLVPPRVNDPACGTGTFIFHAIRQLRQRFEFTKSTQVVGIDVNPLMVEIAKTNYLLALGRDQLIFDDDMNIPVFCFDTLKLSNENLKALGEFDIVAGNPPWGSLRDIKNPYYQKFIKKLAIDARLIEKKDTHLYTQIEVSTIFFVKCMQFLKRGGTLAFVMPRSIIGATLQNYNFTRAEKLGWRLTKILDLESVKPLFNMPTCVLMGEKDGGQTYPIKMVKYFAKFPSASYTLTETTPYLTLKEGYYTPELFKFRKKSHYYNLFKVGVSIFPRSFYFIIPIQIRDELIEVKTSDEILKKNTKKPWKISLSGRIERKFIYYTLLGWEVLPYFFADLRLVVLPVERKSEKFQILRIEDMYKKNALGLAKWFKTVEEIWHERRTPLSKERFPSIIDRFNYGKLLDHQSPARRFIVLYNATGRDVTSCIIDRQKLPPTKDSVLKPVDFISGVKTWAYETNNFNEALYLCGVLNSDVINEMIKPLQPKGLGGPRAIHRRPLMVNIPKINESDWVHQRIAELASHNVEAMIEARPKGLRKKIKKGLPYNGEINNLVKRLLRE